MAKEKPIKPGENFVGEWKVVDSSNNKRMIIKATNKEKIFDLYEKIGGNDERFLQTLRYMPRTATLENLSNEDGQKPHRERCIAFWNRREHNRSETNSIFAKRIKVQDIDKGLEGELMSWEGGPDDNDTGTWGAEEGGG